MRIGRSRAVLAATLAAGVAAVAPATATAVTARSANSFVESIGVNVHLDDYGTPYAENLPLVEQRLGELGVHHVRGDLFPNDPTEYRAIRELAAQGIESDMIVGDPSEPEAALGQMLAALKSPELAGALDAVEGPNEYSTSGDPEWKKHLVAYQERLYRGIKEDPALAALPVIGPSIVHNDQAALGDVSAFFDYGNIHSYPEGGPPEEKVGKFIERAKKYNSGAKPIFATETGYTNATKWSPTGPGENRPISEEAAGIYMPRLFFEYWNDEIVRTYSYELVDQRPNTNLDNREDHFGLLRNDLSPKPAFTALQNTIGLLADPGLAFPLGSLGYSLEDRGAVGAKPVHSALLEKRDGSFYLALWRLQSVWNPATKEPESPTAEPVNVTLPAGAIASYAVYEPSLSAAAHGSGGPTDALTLNVGPGVTIVKLVPATPEPPGEPPPGQGEPSPGENPPTEAPVTTAPVVPPAATAPVDTTVLAPPFMPPVTVPTAATAPHCLVPKLKGRRFAAARRAVRAAGCELGSVTKPAAGAAPATSPAAPTVLAQRPRAGTGLAAGSKVAITLSH